MKNCYVLGFILTFLASTASAQYKVVDGDSLEYEGKQIRLQGIDAPEFTQICMDANHKKYECGQEATKFLQKMIENSQVDCVCEQKDKYKRDLCECFANGVSINRKMVANGHAMAYKTEKYVPEQQAAQNKKIGIWQGKFMRPAIYRILNKPQR